MSMAHFSSQQATNILSCPSCDKCFSIPPEDTINQAYLTNHVNNWVDWRSVDILCAAKQWMVLGHSFAHPVMAFVLDAGIVRVESIAQDLAPTYS